MNSLTGFHREDGSFGIRNHLFTLPAVVCANQVAIDVASHYPQLKYIEHQHGCAQIGADLLQTRQIFSQLALHPNVYGSMMVSLGCEGLVAKDLFETISNGSSKPLELVVIQDSGGTLNTEKKVEEWVIQSEEKAQTQVRESMNWSNLVLGLMFDADVSLNVPLLKQLVSELLGLNPKIILPDSHSELLQGIADDAPRINYGHSTEAHTAVMKSGSNSLETATGLTASGAHLILHFTSQPHAFGSPLAPTARWCLDEKVYSTFYDDYDGPLSDEVDIPRLMEKLTRIVNGVPTVAESMGMDDFALYRIGPTV